MPVTSPDFQQSLASIAEEDFLRAAAVIKKGGVVAFPTETFYGLAVDPFNVMALERLFHLKGRSPDKPFLVLIDKIESLGLLVRETPDQYRNLITEFWPGPLTLIFTGLEKLPGLLMDSSGTVGVRLSSHPVARRLAEAAGGAITGTSANPSGLSAAVNASGVREMFPVGVDYVIDGGVVPGGPGSAIVGIGSGGLKLIRDGTIPFQEIIAKFSGG